MPRRSGSALTPEQIHAELSKLICDFASELEKGDLRQKVRALVPAFIKLRQLGASLVPDKSTASASERIITYMCKYSFKVIDGDELMVVAGIDDWARCVRKLRVEQGWRIYTGLTIKQMTDDDPLAADEFHTININPVTIKKEQYVLLSNEQDRDSAHRWHMLNTIRKKKASVKEKILEYLRTNVGRQITGDEMKYLAKDKSDWPRQVRSLRTEEGWPIATKNTGRSDLPVGVYVLEEDRQAEPHDRAIKDDVRVEVLKRDGFSCTKCGWNHAVASVSDPRKRLELHHVVAHKDKGSNEVDNLTTLCNVCHVKAHRSA